jgi:hypothetical protein
MYGRARLRAAPMPQTQPTPHARWTRWTTFIPACEGDALAFALHKTPPLDNTVWQLKTLQRKPGGLRDVSLYIDYIICICMSICF